MAFRNFTGYSYVRPLYYTVSIVSLAVSCSLMFLMVDFVLSQLMYDTSHDNPEKIYRIETALHLPNGDIESSARLPLPAASLIAEHFSEISSSTNLLKLKNSVAAGAAASSYDILFVDSVFFKLFNLGEAAGFNLGLDEIVLSQKSALKLFGKIEVVGKVVTIDGGQDLRVVEVLDDTIVSHFEFDMIASIYSPIGKKRLEKFSNDWYQPIVYCYVQVSNAEALAVSSLEKFVKQKGQNIPGAPFVVEDFVVLNLRELTELHFDIGHDDDLFSNAVSYDRFRLFVLASILILLVSSLNFLNLTLAVEQQGAKEQILHQLVGASKSQLLGSNLKRSAGLAIVVSLLAVVFVEITQSIASTYVPELKEGSGVLSQRYAAWAVGVFVGVVGISSFSWWIINGRVQLNLGQSVDQRFSMSLQGYFSVFVQSLVSCLLISVGAMLLVQNHIWVTGNHGYDERNRLTFNVTRLNDELESQLNNFVGTMKNDTRVESVVRSSWRPFAKSRSMIALRGARHTSEDEMYIIDSIRAGDDFFNLWDIEIIVGEVPLGFNSTLGKSRPTRVVLTEEAAYSLGYKDSSYALGEVLYAGDDSFEVVAVSQNFQLGPISQQRSAAIILPQESSGNYVTVLSSQLSTNQILDLWRSLSDKEVIVESVESLKMNEYEADTQLGRMLMGAGVLSGLFCLIGIIAVSVLELKKLLPDMTTMRILGASEVDMGAHFLKFTVVPVILGALACAVIITSPLANPVHVLIMGSSLDIRIGYLSIGLLVSIATLTILLIYVALRPVELSLAARSD